MRAGARYIFHYPFCPERIKKKSGPKIGTGLSKLFKRVQLLCERLPQTL